MKNYLKLNKRVLITLFIFIARPIFGIKNEKPLFLAARAGDINMANQLLNAGTNVDDTNEFGYTVLICAAAWGNTGLVRLLLERGANINVRTDAGWTTLSLASQVSDNDIVDLLLRNHADVSTSGYEGRTAIHNATLLYPAINYTWRDTAVIDQLHEEMHPVYD